MIRSYIASPDVTNSPCSSVPLSSETLMGRMYGKNTLPFTRDNEKRKTNSRPPPTWSGPSLAIVVYCRERHVDGFDVRWIYITITTVLAAVIRFSRLSSTTVLLFFFLTCLIFCPFVLFQPSLPSLLSSFFSLFYPRFLSPSHSLRCCMYVYMCVLYFFSLLFFGAFGGARQLTGIE